MNTQTTVLSGLTATLTANRDAQRSFLLVTLTADELERTEDAPARVAFVIDRSGSMGGPKLASTRVAVARMLRSLRPDDRAAVVAYDDRIDVLSGPEAPGERLAGLVEALEPRGSTNLYGGWLEGARLIGEGGRVVLLSDGLANQGRCTHAADLASHARRSYEHYGVTTSTIGVGSDYDEALMSGMARHGGGSHYFARDVEGILEAFSQERFSLGADALTHVSLEVDGQAIPVGHLWSGEVRHLVVRTATLGEAVVRYTVRATGESFSHALQMPAEFGHSDPASLEELLDRLAQAQDAAAEVRDPASAREVKEAMRALLFELRNHALADEPRAEAIAAQIERSMAKLDELERRYDEREATVFRKHSHQHSHNMRVPLKGFNMCAEDRDAVMTSKMAASSQSGPSVAVLDPEVLRLAPIERWRNWGVLPTQCDGTRLWVLSPNPNDGILFEEIGRALGMRVEPVLARVTPKEIEEALRMFA